eukprot:403367246
MYGDQSVNCQTNKGNGVSCSPVRAWTQNFFYTYCKGANNPSSCGVDNTDLIANQNSKTVSVNKFPWRVVVSTQPNYLACSYHIYAEEYTWKQGSKLHLNISTFNDVKLYLYGGNSRENASHIILNNNNSTLAANQTYKIDVEVGDLMLLVLPIQGRTSATTYYTFSYQIHGENYSWWEQLIIGKNGRTYFIIAIASASLIFFLIAFGLKPWSPTNNNRHFGNSLDQTQNNQDNFLAKPQRSKRSVAATFRKQTNQ